MIDRIAPAGSPTTSPLDLGATDLVRGAAGAAAPATEGADFGAMLGTLASNAMGAIKEAETISVAGVRGSSPPRSSATP